MIARTFASLLTSFALLGFAQTGSAQSATTTSYGDYTVDIPTQVPYTAFTNTVSAGDFIDSFNFHLPQDTTGYIWILPKLSNTSLSSLKVVNNDDETFSLGTTYDTTSGQIPVSSVELAQLMKDGFDTSHALYVAGHFAQRQLQRATVGLGHGWPWCQLHCPLLFPSGRSA